MKTIKEAAESAAKEVFPQLCTGLSEDTVEFYKARDVIARHFADFAALRDAAERALTWLQDYATAGFGPNDLEDYYCPCCHHGNFDFTKLKHSETCELNKSLTALRGLLNTQPTKET